MLKRAFALSDQGAKDLAKGIIATACANLIQIIPASLLLMVVMMLLEKAAGTQVNVGRNIPFFVGITLVLFGMIAIAQLVQYNLTYTAAYKESANRRIVLAEKLRKLPLSFFEKKNLADLTTTIMGDCTALERTFSNAIPQLLGTILMFVIMSVGLAVLDWRMALCIIVPVPVASIVVVLARKAQSKAELENLEAKRCAYDAVQEYIDTIKELKAYSKTDVYLDELDKKLENVIRCSFRNELAPGASTTAAQFILRFGLVSGMLVLLQLAFQLQRVFLCKRFLQRLIHRRSVRRILPIGKAVRIYFKTSFLYLLLGIFFLIGKIIIQQQLILPKFHDSFTSPKKYFSFFQKQFRFTPCISPISRGSNLSTSYTDYL